ncbi:unnamed protein product, partial [Discosporangium mesarthrocarpum]
MSRHRPRRRAREGFCALVAVVLGSSMPRRVANGREAYVPPAIGVGSRTRLYPRSNSAVMSVGNEQALRLEVAGAMMPHPAKAARGGEDAYFALESDLGVFDGVGGWKALGHDPGEYTRGFAAAVEANITAQREALASLASRVGGERAKYPWASVDLTKALTHGVDEARGMGTCTACLVTFNEKYGMLKGVNLGDSGAILVRRDTLGSPFVALRSESQRHQFNLPYQIGAGSRDNAEDGEPFLFYVREGDIIILATDGLFDNMFEGDIVRCLAKVQDKTGATQCSATDMAKALANKAFRLSQDEDRVTPWELDAVAAGVVLDREAKKNNNGGNRWGWPWWKSQESLGVLLERSLRRTLGDKGFVAGVGGREDAEGEVGEGLQGDKEEDFRGGKPDDITVVVAVVRRKGA